MENRTPMSITAIGSTLYLATESLLYSSTDSGTTWTPGGLKASIWQIAQGSGILFAVTGNNDSGSVYYNYENTPDWSRSIIDVTYNSSLLALATNSTWVFAGGSDGTVWRAPVSWFTSVRKSRQETGQGGSMGLYVNRNGVASITVCFSLSFPQKAEITVFNLSGACVATLFRGIADAGSHRISWNTNNLPNGRYLVNMRRKTGESVQSFFVLR
jgi:hypothetical protein